MTTDLSLSLDSNLAPYACFFSKSKGRFLKEPCSSFRSDFQRDKERIIHSRAFRRLKHKTQVFICADSDHYRTRLTHTIEVAQIARALARNLFLNEDLTEAIALAHDLGHPPFGHIGENKLNELMHDYGGFDHNAQAFYLITCGEDRYVDFKGLNLTWESLEGIVKHNGPLKGSYSKGAPVAQIIEDFDQKWSLSLDQFSSLESQCAAIADNIAYNAHDIDDGLRAKILTLDLLKEVTLTSEIIDSIKKDYPNINDIHCGYELARRQISIMIKDVVRTTKENLNNLKPQTVEDIYKSKKQIVSFSPKMQKKEIELKKFLYKNFYHHDSLQSERKNAENIIQTLFTAYMEDPHNLPESLKENLNFQDFAKNSSYAQIICNFLSGMTDNYAKKQYEKLL